MALNITSRRADELTRKFAKMRGVSLSEAVTIAMEQAIILQRQTETPLQTAERLREKHGIKLTAQARKPLPKKVFDDMWES